MTVQATPKIMLAYVGLITFSQAIQFEKLSVAQTTDNTTVTLRAYIPTQYNHPQLTNCNSIGTTLNCDLKTKIRVPNLISAGSFVPHILSVTLPYRADVWQINITYQGHYYKTGG
jgi:hypothetical protein